MKKQILNTRYYVYCDGTISSINYKNTNTEKKIKPSIDNKGYLRVALYIDNKLKTFKVHRLVALYFIENEHNKPQVNHIDGNKQNNNIENLEWVTNSENQIHAIKNGLVKSRKGIKRGNLLWLNGENNHNSILNKTKVEEIRKKFIPRKYTRKMLALEYGVKEATIKDIILNRSWKTL